MEIVIFVISLVVSSIIVNGVQNLYMKVIGANMMFFSGKKKLVAIIVIAGLLASGIINMFGISN